MIFGSPCLPQYFIARESPLSPRWRPGNRLASTAPTPPQPVRGDTDMNDATLPAAPSLAPFQATPASPARQSQSRLIAACSIGNALEMYDFTVYSFFALLIGK